MRTRVKICGITRPEDALAAVAAGADAIGLVFYEPSPRYVTIKQAQAITAVLPPFVTTVGLFVDAPVDEVMQTLAQVSLDVLQFHGNEHPNYCASFGRRYMKAIRMRDGVDLAAAARDYHSASGLLVDAYVPNLVGGTGQTFDWARLPAPADRDFNLILAGGLNPSNIASAITQVAPDAVDVSGGVEEKDNQGNTRGGIKSPAAIEAFMKGVMRG